MGRILCGHKFSVRLDKYLGMQLLDYMVSIYLTLYEIAKLSPKAAVLFCIPISSE